MKNKGVAIKQLWTSDTELTFEQFKPVRQTWYDIKHGLTDSGGRWRGRGEVHEEERSQEEQKSGEEINQNQEAHQLQVGVGWWG